MSRGHKFFDTKSNWLLVGQCVREALASACTGPDAVAAVSATSMREGMVLYDQHDEEVWACPNADSRADWSERIVHISGLEREIIPSVVEAGTVFAGITAQAAAEMGLTEGTPGVVGGADTRLVLLAMGITRPGSFTVVGGRSWQQTMLLDRPLVDPLAPPPAPSATSLRASR